MDSASKVADITQVVRERFPKPEKVLGSYLGSYIRQQLPNVDLKIDFGGLRSLIYQHFRDQIREVGRSGSDIELLLDFTQVLASSAHGVSPQTEELPSLPPLPPARTKSRPIAINAWRALANPSSIIRAFWNPVDLRLELLTPDADAPADLQEVRSVTYEELNHITKSFLAEKGVSVPVETADPTEPRKYGPRIMAALREMGLYEEWDEYRTEKILHVLGTRLLSLGATEKTTQQILSDIRASKPQLSAKTLPVGELRPMEKLPPPSPLSEEQKLRAFFVRAIQAMSIDELRQLRLSGSAIEFALKTE